MMLSPYDLAPGRFHPRGMNDGSRGVGFDKGQQSIIVGILVPRGRSHRMIWAPCRKHRDRAQELLATVKDFAGDKRAAIVGEAAWHKARAEGARNLYLCAVCGAWGMWGPTWVSWGTMDEVEATLCSDGCKRKHRPPRRRAQ